MEFLEGESLADRLKREGKLPVDELLRIGRETAEGLSAAHQRGLIHRDVKPGNLWLEAGRGLWLDEGVGRVKILDFGLARATADGAHLTQQGAIVGTPAYMAPEQAGGRPVDGRSDLFSLGCVLYRMATGELPFKGTDAISTLMAVSTEDPRPPQQLNPDLPTSLCDLMTRMLAKKPEGRPESPGAVVETIRIIEREQVEGADVWKALGSAPPPVRPALEGQADGPEGLSKTMPVESIAPAPSDRARARPSGRRWVLIAVVVAFGILGVGGYLLAPTVFRIVTNQANSLSKPTTPTSR
jgi:serine/threonine protein kinase